MSGGDINATELVAAIINQKENLINFSNSKKIKDFFKLFTNKKVIVSLLITIAILVIFRIGALVALPGVNFLSNSQQQITIYYL